MVILTILSSKRKMLVAGAKQRNYEALPLGMDSDEEVTAGVADAHLVTDERMNR